MFFSIPLQSNQGHQVKTMTLTIDFFQLIIMDLLMKASCVQSNSEHMIMALMLLYVTSLIQQVMEHCFLAQIIVITVENCLFSLKGCKPEQQMMYSGSKNALVREIGATKVIIIFHLGCQENSTPKTPTSDPETSDLKMFQCMPNRV